MIPIGSGMGGSGMMREMDSNSMIVFGPFVALKCFHCERSTFRIFKIGKSHRMAISIFSKSGAFESLLSSENGNKFFENNIGGNISNKEGGGGLNRRFHEGKAR
jgi:hypothetical protein